MQDKFFKYLKKRHNIDLNEQQRQAAIHREGPCLVLAVPGAGKTTVLITRLAILTTLYRVPPENILCLTFSKASANDMKERYNQLFSDIAPAGITFATIHSFALSVIRNYERMTGRRFKIIEDMRESVNKSTIIRGIYREVNKDFISDDKFEELVNQMGYVKNAMLDIDTVRVQSIRNFKEIYKKYSEVKERHSYIDFDDMLTLAYRILRENERLLNYYRNQYKHILVDESQDSSRVQNRILELVAKPLNNIYMVGDDDQSIYGFRAADPSQMLNFSNIYSNAKIYFMEQNYRSTINIVRIADEFIGANDKRYRKALRADREDIGKLEVIEVENEERQLQYIIEQLENCESRRGMAILYRNNLSALPFVDAFDRRGIRFYMKESKGGLLKYRVTQDIIAILSVALNKFDRTSFERIYFKVNSYLSKEVISYIKSLDEDISIFEGVAMCPYLSYWQKDKFKELEQRFRELAYKPPGLAIKYILFQLDYGEYLRRSSREEDGDSIQVSDMIMAALESIGHSTTSIAQFISRIHELENIMETSKYNKNSDAVTLTTIHSAKGLEFDTCFIVDAINGQFPNCESQKTSKEEEEVPEYEEERRLFYVGMTRAKNNLYIFDVKSWNGQVTQGSDFVDSVKRIIGKNNDIGRIVLQESSLSEAAMGASGIGVGTNVYHTSFGYGRVKSIESDIIVVDFEKNGIRKMLLSICLSEKRLRICG